MLVENYRRRFGQYMKAEVTEVKDMLRGTVEALDDNNNPIEGTKTENCNLTIDNIKDEAIKQSFIGKKPNDTIDFDLRTAFPTDNEVAGLLLMKQEDAAAISGQVRFTIGSIKPF